jgi:uncharacterized membrane protein YeaQ/YmgE (transglycosylase-associated protein family)
VHGDSLLILWLLVGALIGWLASIVTRTESSSESSARRSVGAVRRQHD